MPDTIDKAVWLQDIDRVYNVIGVLDQLYDSTIWTGGLLFMDMRGGFLLVACFDPDTYVALGTPWETLFPPDHLRALTLEEACSNSLRYRPWLTGEVVLALRFLKLLPVMPTALSERDPPLAVVQAERDPRGGLP